MTLKCHDCIEKTIISIISIIIIMPHTLTGRLTVKSYNFKSAPWNPTCEIITLFPGGNYPCFLNTIAFDLKLMSFELKTEPFDLDL